MGILLPKQRQIPDPPDLEFGYSTGASFQWEILNSASNVNSFSFTAFLHFRFSAQFLLLLPYNLTFSFQLYDFCGLTLFLVEEVVIYHPCL